MLSELKPLFIKPALPPEDDPHLERTSRVVQSGMLFSLMGHATIFLLFTYFFELFWLTLVNGISSITFLVLYPVSRMGKHHLALFIASFEGLFFALSITYLAGWESGFYLWLIIQVMLIFVGYRWTWLTKTGLLLLSFGCLIFAVLVLKHTPPYYQIVPYYLEWIYHLNLLNIMFFSVIAIYLFSSTAETAEINLNRAHRRTRELLLNILPSKIADRLEKQSGVIADNFSEASILFSDLVGFTKFSNSRSAEEVVKVLNGIITGFDRIVLSLGLEKIKTIGDGYMVAAGVPEIRKDHATVTIRCAQQMLEFIGNFNQENGTSLQLRIGINSGTVVAGVIGENKFTYDLWGDTVNIAARMESHGLPGKIHISPNTHQLIRESYESESRGVIQVKGKGEMETYFVK